MRLPENKQKLVSLAVLALLLTIVVPGTAFADQREWGRGREHGNRYRKCGKFVNCHDARDGRWDRRGPRSRFARRNRFDDRYRIQDYWRRQHIRNRIDRFDVREANRSNTIRIRRGRG